MCIKIPLSNIEHICKCCIFAVHNTGNDIFSECKIQKHLTTQEILDKYLTFYTPHPYTDDQLLMQFV